MRLTNLTLCLALALTALVTTAAGAHPYFNSSEPGCSGSDPNVLMCDDFEDGVWYGRDGDHQTEADDGWFGTIYANPITPANAIRCGAGVTPFGNCAASGGAHSGQGGRNMAQHRLKTSTCGTDGRQYCGVSEVYVRWYAKWDPGYQFGAEKHMNITNGDGDIAFVNVQLNCAAGSASAAATPYLQAPYGHVNEPGNCGPQNQGSNITIQSGRWYFFELHVRAGSNGLVELWVNDCGAAGTSCGSAPTLRTRLTGNFPGNANGNQIQTIWLENWANPPSSGTGPLWDQLKVSRVGPIGFAGGGGQVADNVPPNTPGAPTLR
jgi:hypothetical protein